MAEPYQPSPEIQRVGRAWMEAHQALREARNATPAERRKLQWNFDALDRELDHVTAHLRPNPRTAQAKEGSHEQA